MRTVLIAIDTPRFDLGLRLLDRQELMDVQTLVAQAAIKRFDERVIDRFSRPREIELDAALKRPVF